MAGEPGAGRWQDEKRNSHLPKCAGEIEVGQVARRKSCMVRKSWVILVSIPSLLSVNISSGLVHVSY